MNRKNLKICPVILIMVADFLCVSLMLLNAVNLTIIEYFHLVRL